MQIYFMCWERHFQNEMETFFVDHLLHVIRSQMTRTSDDSGWFEDNASSWFHDPVTEIVNNFIVKVQSPRRYL
jgi:hypothetical protein